MNILGIIPARGGSKGIPGKNIKTLGTKPLIQYTFESAKKSELLSRIILSSENQEIISVAKKIKLDVPFVRPEQLALDETPSIDVILHALKYFKDDNIVFDAVCLLQPTTPFRKENFIDEAIEKFINGNFDSLITVRKLPDEFNPHWIFEEKEGRLQLATGEREIITRRQGLPAAYFRDGAVYLTKTEVLLKQRSLYGTNIGFIENEDENYVNLDTLKDWKKAEDILKNKI
ncbi:acylneuraminate cytidylyltransferase family protein [Christiangramia sp. SM2212]|uniref:Acylneuraminate cytidylyltransferase family protein n=1 Tax=Christiangramia sediminicola TaxID=3073267 RepID=A0ABU1EMR5_9FLAO|nr:acylneuraminate cytidylyltransferase family protein [Christiangramia sp. SM2212]MDR5589681.1 acylneuraminate cytidylyltransferase family protein [Christiangramia sp. SM2212]